MPDEELLMTGSSGGESSTGKSLSSVIWEVEGYDNLEVYLRCPVSDHAALPWPRRGDNPAAPDGTFSPNTELFCVYESVHTTNPHVLEVLREHGKLLHADKLRHSYPHCWRYKTPLYFPSNATMVY